MAEEALAALRARVVAAGGPAGASAQVASEWMRFAEAVAPKFAFDEDGLYLVHEGGGGTQKDVYACLFAPVWDAHDARMLLKCRMGGCKSGAISYHVYSAADDKTTFPFSNAFAHLNTCCPRMLRRADFLQVKQVKKPSAGGGG